MAETEQEERGEKDFFGKLKTALKRFGAEELADSLKKHSSIRIPNNPHAAKEALDFFLKKVFVEITAETSSGKKTFVCCSDYGFVKRFSKGKPVQGRKRFSLTPKDPFESKSKTMVLTWDLLDNKMISIKTDRYWEMTGIPIFVPEEFSEELADLFSKILHKLYTTKRS